MSSSSRSSLPITAGSSLAGLMPMQASPEPSSSPSRIEAVMPLASSKGWLGCSRALMRPRKPMVLRNAVTTSHFLAARIRSWLRINLQTAAAISAVRPPASLLQHGGARGIREQEIAEAADRLRGDRRKGARVMAVDDQAGDFVVLIGNDGRLQKLRERGVRQRHPRRDHLLGTVGGNSGQPVPGARWARLGHQFAQVGEDMSRGVDGVAIDHGENLPPWPASAMTRQPLPEYRKPRPQASLRRTART